MGNIRSQQISNSQSAIDQAEANKVAAAAATSVPALRVVVEANATALQSNSSAIQRLEDAFAELGFRIRGTTPGSGSI